MSTKAVYHSPLGHHVILEHAGYTPFDMPHRNHYPLWDREHFYDEWDGGFYDKEDVLSDFCRMGFLFHDQHCHTYDSR